MRLSGIFCFTLSVSCCPSIVLYRYHVVRALGHAVKDMVAVSGFSCAKAADPSPDFGLTGGCRQGIHLSSREDISLRNGSLIRVIFNHAACLLLNVARYTYYPCQCYHGDNAADRYGETMRRAGQLYYR